MKNFSTQVMLEEAANEIEKFAPKHSHVEIDVKEDPVGHFRTHIKLTTKYKTYFAHKEDLFIYKSFSKAVKAIKAQLQKKRSFHQGIIRYKSV